MKSRKKNLFKILIIFGILFILCKAFEVEVISLLRILTNQHFLNKDLESESLSLKKILKIVMNYFKKEKLS